MHQLLKNKFVNYLSLKHTRIVEFKKNILIRFGKLGIGLLIFSVIFGQGWRYHVWWDYDLDILKPKISKYHTNRLGIDTLQFKQLPENSHKPNNTEL